jgi:hypothetical protein
LQGLALGPKEPSVKVRQHSFDSWPIFGEGDQKVAEKTLQGFKNLARSGSWFKVFKTLQGLALGLKRAERQSTAAQLCPLADPDSFLSGRKRLPKAQLSDLIGLFFCFVSFEGATKIRSTCTLVSPINILNYRRFIPSVQIYGNLKGFARNNRERPAKMSLCFCSRLSSPLDSPKRLH